MHDDSSMLQRRALPAGRQVRAIAIVAAIAIIVAMLWSVLGRRSSAATGAPPAIPAGQVKLSAEQLATLGTAIVTAMPFHDAVAADGQIAVNADTTTQVFSAYSGRVVKVLAGVGDKVRRGEALVTLDASENLEAQSGLITALSQARLAQLNETRRHAAYESHGGSLQDWQQAQADLTTAEAAWSAARGRLRVLGSTDAQIQALETSGTVSATASITAPITGLVTDRQIGPGQVIQAGDSTPVFTVADLSTVWLLAAVRDSDAAAIAPGQAILLQLPALPGHDYHATVQSVGALVDPATHRVTVRATVANADGRLRPSMLAMSQIMTSPDTVAPGVPEAAIVREGEQAHVWVVRGDGLLEQRAILTGRSNGTLTEVRQGLKPGERIVTRGSLFIDSAEQPD